jgi:AcrR family transcriptional regulator
MSPRSYRSPRRAQKAEDTRRVIVETARALFATRGYAHVTVAEIAAQAGVAPQTVYASTGGKSDIMERLLNEGVEASQAETTIAAVRSQHHVAGVLRLTARGVRQANEAQSELLDILEGALAVHEDAAKLWDTGTVRYKAALATVVEHMASLDDYPPDRTRAEAADTLWFYFGIPAWRTLVKDLGWSWDAAEAWLCRHAAASFS